MSVILILVAPGTLTVEQRSAIIQSPLFRDAAIRPCCRDAYWASITSL
jgi:hypothetical protein